MRRASGLPKASAHERPARLATLLTEPRRHGRSHRNHAALRLVRVLTVEAQCAEFFLHSDRDNLWRVVVVGGELKLLA